MRDYAELVKGMRDCSRRNARVCMICGAKASNLCEGTKSKRMFYAADAIEELQAAAPQWISVEERLPETISAVLVYCPRNKCTYTAIWSGLKWWHFGGGRSDHVAFPVTYWMPLPEPPKEVE